MSDPERLETGPPRSPTVVALAHGAGAGMDTPFMNAFAEGIAAAGHRVVRFEFPYMAARRRDGRRRGPDREPVLRETWVGLVGQLGAERLVIGGKSMGGRIASLVADELAVRGLVCLGYPFHPPGRPERVRTAHLASLVTPTLIVQGTRDRFGTPAEVAQYHCSSQVRVAWIEDGDHDLKPRRSRGRSVEQARDEAITEVLNHLQTVFFGNGPGST